MSALLLFAFADYAGADWPLASIAASRVAFPSTGDRIGALNEIVEAQSPRPPMPLSTLQAWPRDDTCKDSGSGWCRSLLFCKGLASPATCRSSPAHPPTLCRSPSPAPGIGSVQTAQEFRHVSPLFRVLQIERMRGARAASGIEQGG